MKTLQDSKGVLQEGYNKVCPYLARSDMFLADLFEPALQQYYNSAFKIALLDQWVVVLTGKQLIEDLRKRPESELSLSESIEDVRRLTPISGLMPMGS